MNYKKIAYLPWVSHLLKSLHSKYFATIRKHEIATNLIILLTYKINVFWLYTF